MKTLLLCSCLFFALNVFAQQADTVHTVVDQPAEFPGGNAAMLKWLHENISYPGLSGEELPDSHVKITFVVEKDGKLSNVRVINSSPEISRHVGGTILSMPRWTPAVHNGQPVRSTFQLPLIICLK
jgi:periplasmic protein TonB